MSNITNAINDHFKAYGKECRAEYHLEYDLNKTFVESRLLDEMANGIIDYLDNEQYLKLIEVFGGSFIVGPLLGTLAVRTKKPIVYMPHHEDQDFIDLVIPEAISPASNMAIILNQLDIDSIEIVKYLKESRYRATLVLAIYQDLNITNKYVDLNEFKSKGIALHRLYVVGDTTIAYKPERIV